MSEFAVEGTELKKMLKHARNEPVQFGFNPGKSVDESVFCMHRQKPAKALGKAAKEEGKDSKFTYGTAAVVDKTLLLTCIRLGIPQLAKKAKRFLKSQKVMLNVEIYNDQGGLVDSDVEEGLPDDSDLLDGDAGDEASDAAQPPGPGQMKPLDTERAKLAEQFSSLSPRIKALPPELKDRVGKHFQLAITQTKSGNIENAKKLVEKIEAVLDKMEKSKLASDAAADVGEPDASPSPGKPVEDKAATSPAELERIKAVQALSVRIVQLAKMKFPAMLVRLQAQTLKQAKGLVDGGMLDEASKLLDELEAKAARSGQAPKARPAGMVDGVDINDKKAFKALELKYEELLKPLEKFKQSSVPAVSALGGDIESIFKRRGVLREFQNKLKYFISKDKPKEVADAIDEANNFVNDFKKIEQKLNAAIATEIDAKSKSDPKRPPLSSGKSATDEMESLFPDSFNFMAKSALLQAEKYAAEISKKKNGKRGVDRLSLGEVVAIYSYTCEDFKELNPYMRNMRDGMSVERQKELSKQAEAAMSGLKGLPTYKGPVYRYDSDAEYFMKTIASNNIRSDKSFFSTSKVVGNTAFGSLLSVIEHKNGREIDFSLHEAEGEVIFLPGTVFAFKSFTPDVSDLAKFNMQKSEPIKDVGLLKSVLDQHFQKGKTLLKGTFELKEK